MESSSCFKTYLKYVSLNVLGMIGLSCYILADTYFVADGLGAEGLAALNLAIPVYSFIHGSGLMLGMGGAARYAIFKGRGEDSEGSAVFTHTLVLVLCFAAVFILAGLFFTQPISRLLGGSGRVLTMSQTYLRTLLLFSPAFLVNDLLICFVRNDGAPQRSMLAMLGGSFSNILLDYIFIFSFHMGIFGAVLATGFAPIISLTILSGFFFKKQNRFHPLRCPFYADTFRHLLATGVPSLVTELSSGIVIIVFNVIMLNLCGNVGVAAYGVIANLALVVIAVYTGIAQGVQPLLSRYYGSGDTKQIRTVFRYALVTVFLLSLLIYLGMFFYADPITLAFNSEHNLNLQKIAAEGMRIYFTGCIFAGFNIILAIRLSCTDHTGSANLLSLLRGFLLIIPLAFLLAFLLQVRGLWLAFPLTELLVAILGIFLYNRAKRKEE